MKRSGRSLRRQRHLHPKLLAVLQLANPSRLRLRYSRRLSAVSPRCPSTSRSLAEACSVNAGGGGHAAASWRHDAGLPPVRLRSLPRLHLLLLPPHLPTLYIPLLFHFPPTLTFFPIRYLPSLLHLFFTLSSYFKPLPFLFMFPYLIPFLLSHPPLLTLFHLLYSSSSSTSPPISPSSHSPSHSTSIPSIFFFSTIDYSFYFTFFPLLLSSFSYLYLLLPLPFLILLLHLSFFSTPFYVPSLTSYISASLLSLALALPSHICDILSYLLPP